MAITNSTPPVAGGLGWAEGFEPSATGTTIRRSTKLSYAHRVKEPFYRNKEMRGLQTSR